ncbi:hypothetical protein SAMN05444169_5464 [Bradyrhizobium erythrophlei]|jgi:hypothetical protein|uniref:Uncharacterized protein n=1 Tax=Bradyrhizobium erythrophlei TaxID=1437360 RepID=A0A1M5PTE3_9BRAD|nr:hypothetical protein SAMN05444169_5464 [Bradyrhizobium erythrophlei]
MADTHFFIRHASEKQREISGRGDTFLDVAIRQHHHLSVMIPVGEAAETVEGRRLAVE